jgi:hypothetical protein
MKAGALWIWLVRRKDDEGSARLTCNRAHESLLSVMISVLEGKSCAPLTT